MEAGNGSINVPQLESTISPYNTTEMEFIGSNATNLNTSTNSTGRGTTWGPSLFPVQWEKWVILLYSIACILCGVGGNVFILYLKKTKRELRKPHYRILAANAGCDLVLCITTPIMLIISVSVSDADGIPLLVYRFLGFITWVAWFAVIHINTLITFERYRFFVYPLNYMRWFNSKKNIPIIITSMLALSLAFNTTVEITTPRKFIPVLLTCSTDAVGEGFALPTLIKFLLYYTVPFISVVVCITKIAVQLRKKNNGPVVNLNKRVKDTSDDIGCLGGESIKRNLKMLLLTNGLLWLTTFPSIILFSAGIGIGISQIMRPGLHITMESMPENNYKLQLVQRWAHLIMSTFSSVFNPLVYFKTHPNIRELTYKALGIEIENSQQYADMDVDLDPPIYIEVDGKRMITALSMVVENEPTDKHLNSVFNIESAGPNSENKAVIQDGGTELNINLQHPRQGNFQDDIILVENNQEDDMGLEVDSSVNNYSVGPGTVESLSGMIEMTPVYNDREKAPMTELEVAGRSFFHEVMIHGDA